MTGQVNSIQCLDTLHRLDISSDQEIILTCLTHPQITVYSGRSSPLALGEFDGLSDYFILRMYEFLRQEVQADAWAGTRLVGLPARLRADKLLSEIERRGLFCIPIDWPEHLTEHQRANDWTRQE